MSVFVLLLFKGRSGRGCNGVGGYGGDQVGGFGRDRSRGVCGDEGLVSVYLTSLPGLTSGEVPHRAVRVLGVVGFGAVGAGEGVHAHCVTFLSLLVVDVRHCQGHSGPILITTPNERLYTVRLSLIPGNRLTKRIAWLSLV